MSESIEDLIDNDRISGMNESELREILGTPSGFSATIGEYWNVSDGTLWFENGRCIYTESQGGAI